MKAKGMSSLSRWNRNLIRSLIWGCTALTLLSFGYRMGDTSSKSSDATWSVNACGVPVRLWYSENEE